MPRARWERVTSASASSFYDHDMLAVMRLAGAASARVRSRTKESKPTPPCHGLLCRPLDGALELVLVRLQRLEQGRFLGSTCGQQANTCMNAFNTPLTPSLASGHV